MRRLLVLAGCFLLVGTGGAWADPLEIRVKAGKSHYFDVKIAKDALSREKGLMGVQDLPENQGMLFIFDEVTPVRFWMKGTLIPLDMIFIDNKGLVSLVHHQAQPFDLSVISSEGPVQAVLEVFGGVAKKTEIQAGDKVISPALGKLLDDRP